MYSAKTNLSSVNFTVSAGIEEKLYDTLDAKLLSVLKFQKWKIHFGTDLEPVHIIANRASE